MTDADDAGLVEEARRKVRGFAMTHDGILMTKLANRLESQRREIEELRRERDAWKNVCSRAGICMSCALGSPEPFGCTDCLNTGWSEGAPQDVHEAKSALAEALQVIEPFAKAGSIFKPRPSDISDQLIYAPAAGKGYDLCGDHLRAASAFAAKHGGRDGQS